MLELPPWISVEEITSVATAEDTSKIAELVRESGEDKRITFADLKIRTKDKKIIPFVPNPSQYRFLEKHCPKWKQGIYDIEGLRELILKGRQQGFTTLIQAIFFCLTLNEPNTQTVIIAHDTKSTETIFQMIKIFYEHLPEDKKPPTKYASRHTYFWPGINSYYSVGSRGRGGTVNNLHFSEVAWHPEAEEIAAGLLQSVPLGGNAVLESTANGLGNYYQTEWEAAGNGDSTFQQYFSPWFENPEYSVEVPHGFTRTEAEEARAKVYGLADGQLAWYRIKSKELKEKVRQEYPDCIDEAFLSSGHPYFDRDCLTDLIARCSDPLEIAAPDPISRLGKNWKFLKVWKEPEEGRRYIISGDTAEGLTDYGDPDFDSASVWDAETYEQVAHLHGRWDTHEFGLLLAELGRWYNDALIGIERNNHGHAVINAVMHSADYPAMNAGECKGVYFHEEYDARTSVKSRKPGWPTTPKTKYFALDGLASSLINRDIKINCKETLGEMMRYVKLPGSKAGGEAGSHDDRVMDAAIGDVLLKLGLWKKDRRQRIVPEII